MKGMATLAPLHEQALGKGGLVVFLVFAVINGAVIAWIIRMVLRRDIVEHPVDSV